MIYSVHIYSDFDAILFNDSKFITQTNVKFGYHFDINTENINNIMIYSSETFNGYKFIPYMINLNEVILKNNNNLVQVKNYLGLNKNVVELTLLPNLIKDSFSLCSCVKTIEINKKKYKVSIYPNQIVINNINFDYSKYINSTKVTIQQINNYIIVIQNKFNTYFVSIFMVEEGIIFKKYECECLKIELNSQENKIKILKKHNNFYQTGSISVYSLSSEFTEEDSYFVKLGNINKNLNSNLIPYAFMHCVIKRDYNYAKNFLCTELKNKLSPTTLSAYFENLVDFEKCKYCDIENCLYVKYKNDEFYKPLKFIIKENKIVDIK